MRRQNGCFILTSGELFYFLFEPIDDLGWDCIFNDRKSILLEESAQLGYHGEG